MKKCCDNCGNCESLNPFIPICEECVYIQTESGKIPSNWKPMPQTNADRIRAMSDEELAWFMVDRNVNESTVQLINSGITLTATEVEATRHRLYCACMQWLKQPAED